MSETTRILIIRKDKKALQKSLKIANRALATPQSFYPGLKTVASLIVQRDLPVSTVIRQDYELECFFPDGTLRWRDHVHNLVVNEGLEDILQMYYKGVGYSATHYVFLTDNDPVFAPGDTMAAHPGWTEFQQYAEGARPLLQMSDAVDGYMDNDANRAQYNINANTSVGGAGVTTDATKGGTVGTLIGGDVLQGGNKPVGTGDLMRQRVIATNASA